MLLPSYLLIITHVIAIISTDNNTCYLISYLLIYYRPISVLTVISKVYEKVFYSWLYDYFSTNNILSSSQFGFRSGASTEHALLKFTVDILKCFDDKKVAIATFRDLSKEFDCVDHKILLTKIKRYGVHSTPRRWIRMLTFLTGNTLYPGIRSNQHH